MKKQECGDIHCPTHGTLSVKGREFLGIVISDKMQKSVTVQWERQLAVPKYERYMKAQTKVKAHNPSCINARVGDHVRIKECRPLSKTKNFVVMDILGKKQVILQAYEQFEKKEQNGQGKQEDREKDDKSKESKGREK